MRSVWASEFKDIPTVLAQRDDLRAKMIALLAGEMAGKATEGGDRLVILREILTETVEGRSSVCTAIALVEERLPRERSSHCSNNRVFPLGWAERLVRTQFSRLYNQAVLELLIASGHTQCFVPHSSDEDPQSVCSLQLADKNHNIAELHAALIESYVRGIFTSGSKIPHHPHCTHVVAPAS